MLLCLGIEASGMNKKRLIHLGLFLTSLVCYLEWGSDRSGFLFQMELEVFQAGAQSLSSILHPLVLIPMLGQIILLITVFQRNPSRRLAVIATLALGVLVLVILLVGILVFNVKIILSTLPFLGLAVVYLFFMKRKIVDENSL